MPLLHRGAAKFRMFISLIFASNPRMRTGDNFGFAWLLIGAQPSCSIHVNGIQPDDGFFISLESNCNPDHSVWQPSRPGEFLLHT